MNERGKIRNVLNKDEIFLADQSKADYQLYSGQQKEFKILRNRKIYP
jgi:hypothetical protein